MLNLEKHITGQLLDDPPTTVLVRFIFVPLANSQPSKIDFIQALFLEYFASCGIDIPIYEERLGQTLMFLSAMNREIVLMYYYLKMSDPQISRILGISKSTVHRRRNETIKKLRILLEDAT